MKLRFLGKDPDSPNNGSPTIYETETGGFVVQGWAVTDPETLAELGPVPDGEDDPDLKAWRAGVRPDPGQRATWWRDWLDLPAAATARGVRIRRLRVVSEPVSEYIHYEYDGTFTNVAAGEDVRWLPRARAVGLLLPANDFWVFDHDAIVVNHFAGNGDWGGEEKRTEPELVQAFLQAFERAWARGIPHADYRPRLAD